MCILQGKDIGHMCELVETLANHFGLLEAKELGNSTELAKWSRVSVWELMLTRQGETHMETYTASM